MLPAILQPFSRRTAALGLLIAGLSAPAPAAAESAPSIETRQTLSTAIGFPAAGTAERITYSTVGAAGEPAVSSGVVLLPPGRAPSGGWPVIAWAHGTSGIADRCAPSTAGPLLPERDGPYLAAWLADGYAIVASDYAGLGTPGVHAYLNGAVAARNVIDMVGAVVADRPSELSRRWMVVGQSQGAAVAVLAARYAAQWQQASLRYRGAVATGTPAYIENLIGLLGPWVPPFPLNANTHLFVLSILSGLRASHPEIDIDSYLTAKGRALVDQSEQECPLEFGPKLAGLSLNTVFRRPLAAIPNSRALLRSYMGLPETGFDRPLFLGQGLWDTTVITPQTLVWAATLAINRQPAELHVYPADHGGTLAASLPDSRRFVKRQFAG